MPVIGPLYFKYRDFPGAKEIADLLLKVRQQQMPYLEKGDEGTPEQTQAKLQQATQQLQEMQQQNQQLTQQLQTEQAKQQATLQKASMDNQAKENIARMEQLTKLLVAQTDAKSREGDTLLGHLSDQELAKKDVAGKVAAEAIKAQATIAAADLNFKTANTQPLNVNEEQI